MSKLNQKTDQTPHIAIMFMIGAGGLIAATSILAKRLGLDSVEQVGLHPLQISAGRFCFAFICIFLFVVLRKHRDQAWTNANWKLHILRSLCGWLGITSMFAAVIKMPVAEAVAIVVLSLNSLAAFMTMNAGLVMRSWDFNNL